MQVFAVLVCDSVRSWRIAVVVEQNFGCDRVKLHGKWVSALYGLVDEVDHAYRDLIRNGLKVPLLFHSPLRVPGSGFTALGTCQTSVSSSLVLPGALRSVAKTCARPVTVESNSPTTPAV